MAILGIDIGGSGVKGAPVDTVRGEFLAERVRVPTPQPSDVAAVVEAVAEVAGQFGDYDRVGITFPGVVVDGVTRTAANVDKSWIGTNIEEVVGEAVGRRVVAVNDADAAGYAEAVHGAARGSKGVVLMTTLGTGIGTALFIDGILLPNTELGHIEIEGVDAELRASDGARQREDLGWKKWSKRVNTYLTTMENLFWPDLIIVGGGVSKYHEKFFPHLSLRTRVVPAQMLNQAGIVGAAMAAAEI